MMVEVWFALELVLRHMLVYVLLMLMRLLLMQMLTQIRTNALMPFRKCQMSRQPVP